MIKRIPRGFNIFTRKNKRSYVSLLIPYIRPSNSNNNESKYTIMFLNASAKDQNTRRIFSYPALMGYCLT